MSEPLALSIVSAGCTMVVTLITAYFAYKAKTQSEQTHVAVNSRMDEFIRNAQKLFHAEGVIQEKTDEQARKDETRGKPPGLISGNEPPTMSK